MITHRFDEAKKKKKSTLMEFCAKPTQNQHAELVPAHFRGTDDHHVGWQASLMARTLTERTQGLRDALPQRAVGHHNLDGAPRDAGFQAGQPRQLWRSDGGAAGTAQHGL